MTILCKRDIEIDNKHYVAGATYVVKSGKVWDKLNETHAFTKERWSAPEKRDRSIHAEGIRVA